MPAVIRLQKPGFSSYTASFSNYGKTEVDVFAPGTKDLFYHSRWKYIW